MARKAFEIVRYLKPEKWCMENPRGGKLKHQPCMQGITFVDVEYCQYMDWGHKKPTRIWGDKKTIAGMRPKVVMK